MGNKKASEQSIKFSKIIVYFFWRLRKSLKTKTNVEIFAACCSRQTADRTAPRRAGGFCEVPHDMRRGRRRLFIQRGSTLGAATCPKSRVELFVFIDSFYVLHEMAFVYLPCDCSTLVYAYAHESESLCVCRWFIWPDGHTVLMLHT